MQTIHTSKYYNAYLLHHSGLIIESTRKTGGVQLLITHAQYDDYVDAIRTALDTEEADSLCKALMT